MTCTSSDHAASTHFFDFIIFIVTVAVLHAHTMCLKSFCSESAHITY